MRCLKNPALQLENKNRRYQANPDIHKNIEKEISWKKEKMWQGWKLSSTSQTRILLHLHNMFSEPVLSQGQIV